jgi:hypothetical protein
VEYDDVDVVVELDEDVVVASCVVWVWEEIDEEERLMDVEEEGGLCVEVDCVVAVNGFAEPWKMDLVPRVETPTAMPTAKIATMTKIEAVSEIPILEWFIFKVL